MERRPGLFTPAAGSRAPVVAKGARYLVGRFSDFAIERCGFTPDEVVGLLTLRKSADRLIAVSSAARDAGWRVGMAAAEARALCPDGALETWDEVAELVDRDGLLRAFLALSDKVAPLRQAGRFGLDGFEGVVLEIHRTTGLFGGEAGVMSRARALAERFGHRARFVIADDPTGALTVARDEPPGDVPADVIIPPGGLAAALAPLPLEVLDLPPMLEEGLRVVGLRRVGELARLETSAVAGRFGADGLFFHRVARGLPPAPEQPSLLTALGGDEPVAEGVVLGGPADTLAPILFVLPGLVARLCATLQGQDRAAVRVCVRLGLERGGLVPVRVRCGRPTVTPAVLTRLVRARLEGLALSSPVSEVTLVVEESTSARGVQPGLMERAEAVEPWPEIVARLTDALGEAAVFRPEMIPRWRPEAAWRPVAADGSDPPLESPKIKRDPAAVHQDREQDLPLPRPPLLLSQPVPVALRGDPWAAIQLPTEEWAPIVRVGEPEHLSGEWWMADGGFTRVYRLVGLEDGRDAWVYEDEYGAWLHGWFD